MDELHKYAYSGPVVEFGKCVAHIWKAETIATSERKALSNFKYQYKRLMNKLPSVKVDLPGKITMIE